jgi:hypothetical protein
MKGGEKTMKNDFLEDPIIDVVEIADYHFVRRMLSRHWTLLDIYTVEELAEDNTIHRYERYVLGFRKSCKYFYSEENSNFPDEIHELTTY